MVALNHHIVPVADADAAAQFYSEVLGFGAPERLGWFVLLQVSPDTALLFSSIAGSRSRLHYGFLVSEAEFDRILEFVQGRRLPYWADPAHGLRSEINRWDDGRGVYFDDLDGHNLEVHTRVYGAGGTSARHVHPLLAGGRSRP